MKIDLANIAQTPGAHGRYPFSEKLALTEEYFYVGPVTGEVFVENTGSLLIVRGHLSAVLRLNCVRCLAEFERQIETEFNEEFAAETSAPDISTIDREEPEASAIANYLLDVSELVRQQVALQVPMAAPCKPDCRGICSHCGKNLNEGECECPPEPLDSRWEKLKHLARQMSDAEKDSQRG